MSALGQMDEGRYSESWVGGDIGQIGNTVYSLSWDGMSLGGQWKFLCPVLSETPVLLEDTVDENGNGHKVYRIEYGSGSFWLSGGGPWGNGDPDYYGELFHYTHTTTMQYVDWELVGYTVNVQLSGYFAGYESCMQLTIANAVSIGIGGAPPGGYPELQMGVEGGCQDVLPGVLGDWGDVWSITMIISDCATANEQVSWGTVKSMYR
jgi:hypothetical protein